MKEIFMKRGHSANLTKFSNPHMSAGVVGFFIMACFVYFVVLIMNFYAIENIKNYYYKISKSQDS
jgi:CHASE3 domain sensor protein